MNNQKTKKSRLFESVKKAFWAYIFPVPKKRRRSIKNYFRLAKNGTITGAADNDPAGIITYSQVGATTGFSLLWLILLTTPMLAAVENITTQIAIVTKKSLVKILKTKFGFKIALFLVWITLICNVLTIAADLASVSELLGSVFKIDWLITVSYTRLTLPTKAKV